MHAVVAMAAWIAITAWLLVAIAVFAHAPLPL